MNQYKKCDDCKKPFKAFTVELERNSDNSLPCGQAWTIWHYEEGVEVYHERHDHEPNGGMEYYCYNCRPQSMMLVEHKF
jgi:hypothetical protein